VIAAGGVRDAADLAALDAAGVPAVLVASALHDGRLAGRRG
jgi:phosphoribosylformimino-5-aminoimidazole carboxamide ribotide isomerase